MLRYFYPENKIKIIKIFLKYGDYYVNYKYLILMIQAEKIFADTNNKNPTSFALVGFFCALRHMPVCREGVADSESPGKGWQTASLPGRSHSIYKEKFIENC